MRMAPSGVLGSPGRPSITGGASRFAAATSLDSYRVLINPIGLARVVKPSSEKARNIKTGDGNPRRAQSAKPGCIKMRPRSNSLEQSGYANRKIRTAVHPAPTINATIAPRGPTIQLPSSAATPIGRTNRMHRIVNRTRQQTQQISPRSRRFLPDPLTRNGRMEAEVSTPRLRSIL